MSQPQTPALTVDVVIAAGEREVVLIRRASEPFEGAWALPFEGAWALPGGFVEIGESVEQAATREASEETGLTVELITLVGVYSHPARDPRGHNVSVAYLARTVSGDLEDLHADTDASEAAVIDVSEVELAFDHRRIIEDALRENK